MAQPTACRIKLTLALDLTHWRRHDKLFWVQVLAEAVNTTAPDLVQVESYEVGDTLVHMRVRATRPPKAMRKLLNDDEDFMRLRARLADLGARSEFEIEEDES